MAKSQNVTIPYPVWDTLFKVEEIARLMKKEFNASNCFPSGTPRSIKIKSIHPAEDESDRLKVTLWMCGAYIDFIIGGSVGSWGTSWTIKSLRFRWKEYEGYNEVSKIFFVEGDAAELLEYAAHGREDLVEDLKALIGESPIKQL